MSRPSQIRFLSHVAGAYDPIVRLMGFLPLWNTIAQVADPAPGQAALDVCTGTGGAALALARRGARVIGFDLADGMLRRACRKRDANGGPPNPAFVRMDARRMAFPDRSFSIVTCSMALHEMAEDERQEVLREIARVASDRVAIAEYRVPDAWPRAVLFRITRLFEYIESDDFETFVRRDLRQRLHQAGLVTEASRDVGPYCIWSCRVRNP